MLKLLKGIGKELIVTIVFVFIVLAIGAVIGSAVFDDVVIGILMAMPISVVLSILLWLFLILVIRTMQIADISFKELIGPVYKTPSITVFLSIFYSFGGLVIFRNSSVNSILAATIGICIGFVLNVILCVLYWDYVICKREDDDNTKHNKI